MGEDSAASASITAGQTTIVIGDDHPLVQAALRDALGKAMPEVRVIECPDLDSVMTAVGQRPDDIDLVLLDLNMPGTHGFAGLFLMLAHHPTVPVAILSALQDSDTIRRALAYGASGYIPKSLSMPAMADAIRAILSGETWAPPLSAASAEADEADAARRFASLSPQQLRILTMIVDGKLNKQIAGDLNVSEQTVKVHVSSILRKLNVVSRTQAAVVAGRLAVGGDVLR
ncbi:DNA-binding NarL/FixJ family response regulator [Azospirillum lipoferum]|uniref:Response regulator transcription factor n=1 Tax=Azospirillum lipoferum TaxID=193 RepID=A0A5A9GFE2_AZOLI|nr:MULTISPECIES: response regulator transcription factor [Azospirillum]KAA0593047.1 response regulator transcription factor [Azospirillum lipoferum]MCP1613886.1 DNA-binding NarL/FixJ family response regulator [Azospirillum lipoferum]MDW5537719.1 response regulator transcription factor [Azospirillum sp. NL1]